MTQPTYTDFYTIIPFLILIASACLLLVAELFIPKGRKGVVAFLSALGIAAALGFALTQIGASGVGFSGMTKLDGFSAYANILLLISGLLSIALAYGYIKRIGAERGEYYILLLFSLAGMMLMAQAGDLIVVFIALELLSIPLYVLSAISRKAKAEEAGIKYFLLGAFASGFIVYGTALVFGATGTTNLSAIVAKAADGANLGLLAIGAALILVGLGYKFAAVPFHMWTPDVYEGAPTSVTAFMAAGAKIAGLVALFRVFVTAFQPLAADMTNVFWALSAVTMIVGNLIAVTQTNVKRMLAYSAIAHAGYILMAFVPYGNPQVAATAIAAGLFHLAAYVIANFGSWGVVIALEKAEGKGLEIADYAGLSKKHPALALAMTVFMISLFGFPPTVGMVGKFYLFRSALEGGFPGLAVIGVIMSLVSAFYYLRIVVNMYMKDGDPEAEREPWLNFTIGLTAIATVVLGLIPQYLFLLAYNATLR
ncbi:MAG: NADH-quinone oxidoreductase subunit N [Anaerolineales bacterium]|nr:NADH-quinone oxidoreductase subunit N [Anaerolineales bacterium]